MDKGFITGLLIIAVAVLTISLHYTDKRVYELEKVVIKLQERTGTYD